MSQFFSTEYFFTIEEASPIYPFQDTPRFSLGKAHSVASNYFINTKKATKLKLVKIKRLAPLSSVPYLIAEIQSK